MLASLMQMIEGVIDAHDKLCVSVIECASVQTWLHHVLELIRQKA